jgi:dihydrofolate reductase/thymidylate synthase
MRRFSIISAFAKSSRGIGRNGKLPWQISEDMKHFSRITQKTKNNHAKNAVIMGRKTFESLPTTHRPLKNRHNIIISSKMETSNHYSVFNNFNDALQSLEREPRFENLFVIGGESIYREAINHDLCERLILTEIDDSKSPYECDTFFPEIPSKFKLVDVKNGSNQNLKFLTYQNWSDLSSDENQYLQLLQDIIEKGEVKDGRNGKVISLFGEPQHKFDLRKGFPLLTTKRMPFKMIIKELLFFIRGDTDAKILDNDSVKIWNGNTTREFLDKRGLKDYKEGDMGPMYGWNWRHFGTEYYGCAKNYTDKGFDQLKNLIHEIVNNPNSRRLLLTTFDPSKVSSSVLAPCHGLIIQFNVSGNYLDCKMYQRSVDTALGYPFNIASYASLMHMIAHVTGLIPRNLFMTLGDTHLYEQHVDKIKIQTQRIPLKFPTMQITKIFDQAKTTIDEKVEFLENLSPEDFELVDYQYYPGIKMRMVA